MKITPLQRASTFCYGLCVTLGVAGAGCVNDHEVGDGELSTSSPIVINVNAAYTIVGVQSGKCVGVVDASTAQVTVEFPNGERRSFLPAYVQAASKAPKQRDA